MYTQEVLRQMHESNTTCIQECENGYVVHVASWESGEGQDRVFSTWSRVFTSEEDMVKTLFGYEDNDAM